MMKKRYALVIACVVIEAGLLALGLAYRSFGRLVPWLMLALAFFVWMILRYRRGRERAEAGGEAARKTLKAALQYADLRPHHLLAFLGFCGIPAVIYCFPQNNGEGIFNAASIIALVITALLFVSARVLRGMGR